MLHLSALIGGLLATIGIAKWHGSNKLFWTLLVSMLLGIAGGSAASSFSKKNKDEVVTSVNFMQGSMALPAEVEFGSALSSDTIGLVDSNLPITSEPAGRASTDRDITISSRTGTSFNPESDIGTSDPPNTS